jgi:hypothetical protein
LSEEEEEGSEEETESERNKNKESDSQVEEHDSQVEEELTEGLEGLKRLSSFNKCSWRNDYEGLSHAILKDTTTTRSWRRKRFVDTVETEKNGWVIPSRGKPRYKST